MKINILYSTDDNYVQHACVSILSLFENNKDIKEIFVYIIDNNISKENKKYLENMAKNYKRNLIFTPISELCVDLKKNDNYPISSYARLFISKLNEIDKIIYIDCDTVINSSLKEMWNIDINNYLVAGVQDNPSKFMAKIIGMDDNDRYINAGVLIINVNKWRNLNINNKFLEFIENYQGKVPHHDQGIINGVCKNEILILEPKYNMMPQFILHTSKQIEKLYDINKYYTQKQINDALDNPSIIHYIEKFYGRPWFKQCTHPMKELYATYLEKTIWKNSYKETKSPMGLKIRKWIFFNAPFKIYEMLEKILNIKRKRHYKRNYDFLDVNL